MTYTESPTHSHSHEHDTSYQMEASRWATGRNVLAFAALVALIGCVAAYFVDPARFFRSYLIAFAYTAAIGLGAFFFVMVNFLAGGAAVVTVRRIMENIMFTLPFGALLFIPIAFGLKDIYSWTAPNMFTDAKGAYLSQNAFVIRTYVYFALWAIWVFSIARQSVKQDTEKSVRQMYINSRFSAPGLFLVILSGTLAAYDWLMSLEPHWYSTIFGLYILAGGALSFMSVVTLVSLGFRKAGLLKHAINKEHYHDLGKWMFALTAFYTYIAFSQYLLIWYANIPEETIWYRHRDTGSWMYVALAMPFIRFFIPFFTLLCKPIKRKLGVLAAVAIWSLVVEYVDLYWVVMPVYYKDGPQVSWIDAVTLLATVSVCGLVFWSRFKKHKMVPVGDLRFEQSLHFENA
jgi:hypothetical protein